MPTEFTQEQHKKVAEIVCTEIAKVLNIMKEHYGEEAYQVLVKADGERILKEWSKKAEESGNNSIEALIKHVWEPLPAHGYEYTMEETTSGFQINCTKCPGADIAKRLGIAEQMFYMYCENDQFIAEGFNPNIGFKMTKTLMQGDDCCNHFYYYKDKGK